MDEINFIVLPTAIHSPRPLKSNAVRGDQVAAAILPERVAPDQDPERSSRYTAAQERLLPRYAPKPPRGNRFRQHPLREGLVRLRHASAESLPKRDDATGLHSSPPLLPQGSGRSAASDVAPNPNG